MSKTWVDEILEWAKSPEGQASIEKLEQKHITEQTRALRIKEHFNNDDEFDGLMKKVLGKQEKYDSRHRPMYTKRSLHITNLLWRLATLEGTEIDPIDGLTENFPSVLYDYCGYQFAITHGQGSVLSIYKNNECIYRS